MAQASARGASGALCACNPNPKLGVPMRKTEKARKNARHDQIVPSCTTGGAEGFTKRHCKRTLCDKTRCGTLKPCEPFKKIVVRDVERRQNPDHLV